MSEFSAHARLISCEDSPRLLTGPRQNIHLKPACVRDSVFVRVCQTAEFGGKSLPINLSDSIAIIVRTKIQSGGHKYADQCMSVCMYSMPLSSSLCLRAHLIGLDSTLYIALYPHLVVVLRYCKMRPHKSHISGISSFLLAPFFKNPSNSRLPGEKKKIFENIGKL